MSDPGVVAGQEHGIESDDVVTVAELNEELAAVVDDATACHHDYVVGDVSDCGVAGGHVHFDLVYDDASVHCVLFGFRRNGTSTDPEDGSRVAVEGDLSFYEPEGSVSLLVTDLVEVGESEHRQAYEQARERLAEAGLLDDDRKQDLPDLPGTVGIVTSADSDARTDAVTAIHARYPDVDIVVQHATVQGDDAVPDLLEAVSVLDRDPDVDVVVVTRGGGADRTLRVFDDPALCRVVAETETPVCAGIGHEDDHTLAGEVADHRVMTPTDAGEIVPERDSLERRVDDLESSLASAHSSLADRRLADLDRGLTNAHASLADRRLADLDRDLADAHERHLAARLAQLQRDLDAAYADIEQAEAIEAETDRAVAAVRAEARRQRRRYLFVIGLLSVLVVALSAYILL